VTRLGPQPGELIDRTRELSFEFDGRLVRALEGDTIASALYAGGRRIFSRSFKYHRPRGLLCCAGQCPNCLVSVDGDPGVRACTEPVRAGMRARHLNAAPSLDRDAMRAVDVVGGPFTPPGFYYKTFKRPRRLWPLYERMLRRAAGLGPAPEPRVEREWRTDYRRRHADVLVVGGGPAGLAAATRAAELGADVVLADEGPEPGGHLLERGSTERARALAAGAREAGVELISPGTALGFFDGLVAIWERDTLHQVRAARHVIATGTIEQPLVFAGNDLPGVMLSRGARRLLALYALAPGRRAVVATAGEEGLEAAVALLDAGVEVAAVADLRPGERSDSPADRRLQQLGVEALRETTVVEAKGRRSVRRAVLARVDDDGRPVPGTERKLDCDLLVVSGGAAPAGSLLLQAGGRTAYEPAAAAFAVRDVPEGLHAAGEVARLRDGEAIELSGALAGADAAHAAGHGEAGSREHAEEQRRRLDELGAARSAVAEPPAAVGEGRGRCFACLCEDVTAKDVRTSIEEGYDSIELSKRYLTVTMGPCQGRMCQLPAARLIARESGEELGSVGTTTARPPWSAVPLGALAGRPIEPAKRSAIHAHHRELGGNVMWAGDWRRPYDYGDPDAEVRAVQEAAGLIDVSTLGKLIVSGPDAGEFLDRLYPNRHGNLKVGRIRYGVLVSDAGRIIDDGTICRLDEESFYVTTTSTGAEAIESWFAWWLADWGDLQVTLTDVTQALCAVNLAGPRAREIMGGLTALDCSAESFAYLDGKRAPVAGVPCLLLRIGFVGELGYEIHYPVAHGQHVWDSIMEAGSAHGIRAFGLEPQRVLRLHKMHVLVGQDTDSESDPVASAMSWIVKLDKEQDFIGRWALEQFAGHDPSLRLVGFELANGAVPHEGAAVLGGRDGALGRVTSSRFSRVAGHTIGLAWVPREQAEDGAAIEISDRGRRIAATVTTKPFYDPDGERLRS
jgi:sarcosine oxidase, subunit alpha